MLQAPALSSKRGSVTADEGGSTQTCLGFNGMLVGQSCVHTGCDAARRRTMRRASCCFVASTFVDDIFSRLLGQIARVK